MVVVWNQLWAEVQQMGKEKELVYPTVIVAFSSVSGVFLLLKKNKNK